MKYLRTKNYLLVKKGNKWRYTHFKNSNNEKWAAYAATDDSRSSLDWDLMVKTNPDMYFLLTEKEYFVEVL